MAHAAIHFSLGLLLGTFLMLPGVIARWRRGGTLASPMGRWLLVSYAFGVWAIVPSLLARAGVPGSLASGPWMNLFLFHPLVRHLHPGGTIIGLFVLFLCFALQYALLLAAIRRRQRDAGERQAAAEASSEKNCGRPEGS
jgi:hypothetical protein